MNDINIIEAVTERDIDLLLLEELNVSNDFAAWFYSAVTESQEVPATEGVWHSITDPELGESDLVILYSNGLAILLENKIDAIAQPNQGHRYRQRGKKGIESGQWKNFKTCMVAPDLYLRKEQDSSVYDAIVSYESISEWFALKNNQRSKYKGYLINEAIEQNRRGYTSIPNKTVTEFWLKYWSLSREQYPELEMKTPGVKPANSDWPEFRPSILDKRFSIVHKLNRGDVDLQISGAAELIDDLSDLLEDHDVEIVQAGKSAAIRMKVGPTNRFDPFEAQQQTVRAGLEAANNLLKIASEIRDKIQAK